MIGRELHGHSSYPFLSALAWEQKRHHGRVGNQKALWCGYIIALTYNNLRSVLCSKESPLAVPPDLIFHQLCFSWDFDRVYCIHFLPPSSSALPLNATHYMSEWSRSLFSILFSNMISHQWRGFVLQLLIRTCSLIWDDWWCTVNIIKE